MGDQEDGPGGTVNERVANEVEQAIGEVAREAYGRLLSRVAARDGDLAAAEDALSEAFASALVAWRRNGIPDRPQAWLTTAARRKRIDQERTWHARHRTELSADVAADAPSPTVAVDEPDMVDKRLELMFVCAHPAIDAGVRTPLMLQTVLGLPAHQIASAFLVAPSTMAARLLRAKRKVRDAKIPFGVPDESGLEARLGSVMESIYAAFILGNDPVHGDAGPLLAEASWLASILVKCLDDRMPVPQRAEAMGLLSMAEFISARRSSSSLQRSLPRSLSTRTSPGERSKGSTMTDVSVYVPLADQPTSGWDGDLIRRADDRLKRAAKLRVVGFYQLQAAIQSVHCDRRRTGRTDWSAIRHLYLGLCRVCSDSAPPTSVIIGLASAHCHCDHPEEALTLLAKVPDQFRRRSSAYHSVAAEAQRRLGRSSEARSHYRSALGLCESPAVRNWLVGRIRDCR